MKKTKTTLILVLVGSLMLGAIIDKNTIYFTTGGLISHQLPDSTFDDSLTEIYSDTFGDTLNISIDGLDSVFTLSDSIPETSDSIEFRGIDITKDIGINPGGTYKEVEDGLFGIHIEGMFHKGHMPEFDNTNYPDTWDWLSDLKPRVIRFPGGASSRWMHLLPYDTNTDGVDDVFPTGYGYNLEEMIRYYDLTDLNPDADDDIEANDAAFMQSIIDDLDVDAVDGDNNEICDNCNTWMNVEYVENLEKNAEKYFAQASIPATQPQRYIDQFIDLIEYISDNEYTPDVIVDLNVMSESANQCKRIVEYLRDAGVNVVGVEMGNETNLQWAKDIMGWNLFDDYWKFINGYGDDDTEYFSVEYANWVDNFYNYVFTPKMQADHNFIATFKTDPAFNCKVGIPAANLKDDPTATPPIYYALKMAEPAYSDDWNQALVTHYTDNFVIGSEIVYKFDAVILHPYYNPNNNWDAIATDNFCTDYYPNSGYGGAPACEHSPCEFPPSSSLWQYGTYDERLRAPFEKILGSTPPDEFGNFKQFIKLRYLESYDQQNIDLKFYLKNKPYKKELWTTEWNLKDKQEGEGVTEFEQQLYSSYCNSFPHGLLIQEWFLKNIKTNYDPDYRQNFHTYATIHAWGGGAPSAMLYHADKGDRANHLDEDGNPDPLPLTGPNLWLRRTLYYTYEMLSEITRKDLKYLPSSYSMFVTNPNINPTVFFDDPANMLYVYYSNMKDETQSYVLNIGSLADLFPGGGPIGFGSALIYNIDANRPYSNSGKSSLFDINTCYNDVNFLHPYEIQGIDGPTANDPECTGLPGGAICVTVPANSFGYFTVPVYSSPREGVEIKDEQLHISPNPASNSFKITCDLPEIMINEFYIDILDVNGDKIANIVTQQNQQINVSAFPSGVYFVRISNQNRSFIITKKLIKIE